MLHTSISAALHFRRVAIAIGVHGVDCDFALALNLILIPVNIC